MMKKTMAVFAACAAMCAAVGAKLHWLDEVDGEAYAVYPGAAQGSKCIFNELPRPQ